MAYVNVAEWKTDQVCEWLKGLDNSVLPYVHSFTNNCVNGQQLLNLRPEDLEQLGVLKLGHQEIILEAVEYLRNFHYELDRENLQLLALHLSCQAHSLHNELSRHTDSKPVTTQTLSDVASVVTAVKPLVRWLDRPPFSGQLEYNDKKSELLKLSLEMATCAQRDRFAEKPIEEIRTTCDQLAKLADYIIQDIADPMILQPASLDLATLKKRPGDDLGFYILPSFHGNHQIAEIKFGSAAHTCGKMEEGDEIVQVNYQTVVGWERKNVLELFSESPAEVLLTLKRRPRHTKVYGQIYIKPYRLPSNKKTPYATRWQHNLPSPRPELLTIPDFTMPLPRHVPKEPSPEPASIIDTVSMLDTMATDSSDSDSEVEPPLSVRLYATKPRNLVQRRATITGASPTTKHSIDIEQFWRELKQEHSTTFQLRDKAASCAHGLDSVPSNLRPQTCLGIEQTKRKKRVDDQQRLDDRKVQFHEKHSDNHNCHGIENFEKKIVNELTINGTMSNNIHSDNSVPLEKCDEINAPCSIHDKDSMRANDIGSRCRKERGKLDKSYSTPAYDLTEPTLTDIIETREPRSKINNVASNCATCAPSIIVNETDSRVSKETLENNEKVAKDNRREAESNEPRDAQKIGSVAKRVNYIESHIQHNDVEDKSNGLKIADENGRNNVVRSNGNETRSDSDGGNEIQSNNDEIFATAGLTTNPASSEKLQVETSKIMPKISLEFAELGRESSEEKSESTSSYMEGTYSSSSEADVPLKKLMENEALIAHGLAERNSTSSTREASSKVAQTHEAKENSCVSRTQTPEASFASSAHNSKYERSETLPRDGISSTRQCVDPTIKSELPKRAETKLRLTPPEPPPRKYFSKPLPLNLSAVSNASEHREQPKISERVIDARAEVRKIDSAPEIQSLTETFAASQHRDAFEGYRDFVEKSTDFIDEPITPIHEQKLPSFVDHYGYTEIYEGQFKEEKAISDRYDNYHEKYGNSVHNPANDHGPPEVAPRSIDSPDGSGCSRQAPHAPDVRTKTLEKDKHCDKGVVNRAMMVARSIGLHSGSNKSSNSSSPRSNRKRNLLLAKRRNVSVKDVGVGDLEGWLTHRSRGAGGAWARSWFVLKSSSLYRFKAQDSTKSDCLIALPGFTASAATEVKSRKYAFKVYHTGTVFYFAADTEDSLALWLDSINKATLGADSQNRTSGLFSETDESDGESKSKAKGGAPGQDSKPSHETMFGSLKKIGRKDSSSSGSGYKDHDIGGASLDRKYLRFLGARNQNVPVPTAQFRSYRRVLPTSTPNRKQDSTPNSPDLRVTVAGSTFYGLSASQSATDVPSTSQDMGDYRQTTDRSQSIRGRRSDDLRGFITLEEFMLAHQNEDRRGTMSNRSASPRITPLTGDNHVNAHHRNLDENNSSQGHARSYADSALSNGMIYGHPRNGEESASSISNSSSVSYLDNSRHNNESLTERSANHFHQRHEIETGSLKADDRTSEKSFGMYRRASYNNNKKPFVSSCAYNRKTQEGAVYYPSKQNDLSHWQNVTNEMTHEQHRGNSHQQPQQQFSNRPESAQSRYRRNDLANSREGPRVQSRNDQHCSGAAGFQENYQTRESRVGGDAMSGLQSIPKRFIRDNGYVGSSGDLTCCASTSETLQRARKEAAISRKGSFNLADRRREHLSPDNHWIDSLRRTDRKTSSAEKTRLKNVAQYQPPPIPSSPFEQDGMRAAFEMHLDKGEQVQKTNRFKSLFGSRSPQKPNSLDLPKETPKTLLGSPRLHRALFRDKSQQQQRPAARSASQSPGDSGISQSLSSYSGNSQSHTLSQSFSSVSSVSDWSPDTPTPNPSKCIMGHAACQKRFSHSNRSSLTPPTLPYIPPPTSPPPDDYPGLEYPPVFEPGTYSLTDASLIRNRSKTSHNKWSREPEEAG